MTRESIEAAALQLSESERARLAELLIASLDTAEDEIEAAWADEAELRYEQIRSGQVRSVPAEEVFERIRSLLK